MAKKKAADGAETESAEATPNKGRSKLVMFGGVAALVAALGGGGAWWFLSGGAKEAQAKTDPMKKTTFVDVPEMTINLSANGQDRQQFLKVKIKLEVADPKLAQDIQPVLPRVLDTFQIYLREMRAADFEGSAAMYRLKEELMRRVNIEVYPAKIDAVRFENALVQ